MAREPKMTKAGRRATYRGRRRKRKACAQAPRESQVDIEKLTRRMRLLSREDDDMLMRFTHVRKYVYLQIKSKVECKGIGAGKIFLPPFLSIPIYIYIYSTPTTLSIETYSN